MEGGQLVCECRRLSSCRCSADADSHSDAIAPDYLNLAGLSSNLYKSTDGGATWRPVATPLSGCHIPHMVRAADGMFYVVFNKGAGPASGGPGRLYKFDGPNWTLLKSADPLNGTGPI